MADQFEYMTHVQTGGLLGRKSEELDRSALEKRLNEMGAEGWEFVWLLPDQNLHREKDGHVLIFKRRVS